MSKRVYNGNMSSRQQGYIALIMLILLLTFLSGCTDGNTIDLYRATRAYARVTERPTITRVDPADAPPLGIYLSTETASFTVTGAETSDRLYYQLTHNWNTNPNDDPFDLYTGGQIQITYTGYKVNNLIAYASRDEHNDSRMVGLGNLVIFFVPGDILTRHLLDEEIDERPTALAFETDERLWYASSEGNLVRLTLNTADPRVLPTSIEPYTYNGFSLSDPQSLVYANNTLYIGDTGNNRILSLNTADLEAAPVTLIDSNLADPLSSPAGLAFANGILYIADTGNNRIVSFNTATPAVPFTALIAPNTEIAETPLANPTALAFANNILYIADSGNGRILSFDTAQPENGATVLLDTASGAQTPAGLAFGTTYETSNTLYISDRALHRVSSIDIDDPASGLQPVAGDPWLDGGAFRGDTMEARYAILNEPTSLAFDNQGNLFLADSNNYRIRYIMR